MSLHEIEPGLLLAAPRMGDPNFEGTVVLLGLHGEDGSLGWTLNGPEIAPGSQIVQATGLLPPGEELPAGFARPARRGGPVALESVWILYQRAPGSEGEDLPGSILVSEDIAVTASVDALRTILRGAGPARFDLLVGYAGWAAGQLAGELAQGAWLPAAADAGLVFGGNAEPARTLWRRAYARAIGTVPEAFVSGTRGSA